MSDMKRKIAAALIALLAFFLIGASAFALLSQGAESADKNNVGSQQVVAVEGQQSSDAENASDQANPQNSSADKTGTSSESQSSGQKAGGNSGSQGSSQTSGQSQSSNIKITVAVTSDAVGNPVSTSRSFTFNQGATVYDALCATGLSIASNQSSYGVYVSSIGGLAEKQHGANSGWMYSVNGSTPMTSCSNYKLKNGDSVVWYYVV